MLARTFWKLVARDRADLFDQVLGIALPVAALEDLLQGKIWRSPTGRCRAHGQKNEPRRNLLITSTVRGILTAG